MTTLLERDARRLTDLLTQQRDVYRTLRDLASEQGGAIHENQPEQLLKILADRQKHITELTEINNQLEPFRSRWSELRESMPPRQRLQVSDLVDEVQRLLAEILKQDEGDCELLKKRTSETRQAAAAAAHGQRLNQAYGVAQPGGPRYLDQKDQRSEGSERTA